MYRLDRGFSLIETLIALAIVGVVLAGINSFFVSSSQSLVRQNGLVEMQANAQAATDFMVRELRHASGTPTISTTVAANDTISFERLEETGYSSGGNSALTLQDSRKSWKVGADGFNTFYTVRITAGMGVGQARTISSNTATALTLSEAWTAIPDTTSHYIITRQKAFTRTSATDNVLRYTVGNSVNQPLAQLITSHVFSRVGKTISITVTATAKNSALYRGGRPTYTLTETVLQRNS